METKPLQRFREAVKAKDPDIELISGLILNHSEVLQDGLHNLTEKNETIRYNSFRALKQIAETRPGVLFPHWDFFITQMESTNTYHVLVGIHILADLAAVDTEYRFEKIFERYYGLLNHRSMVVVSHVCLASGRLMKHKPGLMPAIVDKLLDIDRFIEQQKHKELIKGAALEAFAEAWPEISRRDEILEYARSLLEAGESPKSRKLARKFLDEQKG